jgi:hypothetical protein
MPTPKLERDVAGALAKARLLERAIYDSGPWNAVVQGCRRLPVALTRHETADDRLVMTGYLSIPCSGITAVELWCRSELVAAWPADPPRTSPLRIVVSLGADYAQRAA